MERWQIERAKPRLLVPVLVRMNVVVGFILMAMGWIYIGNAVQVGSVEPEETRLSIESFVMNGHAIMVRNSPKSPVLG